jgi:hypothetical protein
VAGVVVAHAASRGLDAQPPSPAVASRVELPITIQRVTCYVVCDTVVATVGVKGMAREQRGQVLSPGRVRVKVSGADTVAADSIDVAVLSDILSRFVRSGPGADLRPGVAPCSNRSTTHAPVFTIAWQSGAGRRTVRVDSGCEEPSGLVQALTAAAQRVTRVDRLPIRAHHQ